MLGIMTTIHPCPLTANIAAISLLSGTSKDNYGQFKLLVSFIIGYVFALVGIAILLNVGLISIPRLSLLFQSVLSAFLGPMLVLVGMILTGMVKTNSLFRALIPGDGFRSHRPAIHIVLMGGLLALSFCPATAFIYFGLLIPLSVEFNQIVLFPLLFGAGALIPIITISIFINSGLVTRLNERWVNRIPVIAGWLLIATGIYISLTQLYL